MAATIHGTIGGMGRRANPAFAIGVVVVPIGVLLIATTFGTVQQHTFAHVMAGVLWTGIDLFMAVVLGPVIGGMSVDARVDLLERYTPKMAFLMPMLALVTIAGGITLALRLGIFPNADPWLALLTAATLVPALLIIGWQFDAFRDRRWLGLFGITAIGSGYWLATTLPDFAMTNHAIVAALGIVVVLTVVGFGLLMPGEVRIYFQMISNEPDKDVISRIGLRNAKLSGIQGVFQLAVIVVMVYLRWGGF